MYKPHESKRTANGSMPITSRSIKPDVADSGTELLRA